MENTEALCCTIDQLLTSLFPADKLSLGQAAFRSGQRFKALPFTHPLQDAVRITVFYRPGSYEYVLGWGAGCKYIRLRVSHTGSRCSPLSHTSNLLRIYNVFWKAPCLSAYTSIQSQSERRPPTYPSRCWERVKDSQSSIFRMP